MWFRRSAEKPSSSGPTFAGSEARAAFAVSESRTIATDVNLLEIIMVSETLRPATSWLE
jgi:hypothetical protein